jgi:hypothetical protein
MSEAAFATPVQSKVRPFLSPARVLVRSLRLSRDNWKEKYRELQKKLKRYQVQAHDACKSRDTWRDRAETAEREVANSVSQASATNATETSKKK